MRSGCLKFLVFLFLATLGLVVSAFTATVALLNHFAEGLPDVSRLRAYEPSETTRIYAANGKQIATLYKENRTWTPLEEISPYVLKAIVATEDARFYTHHGVDPVGVARAAVYDLVHKGSGQGASTITMQLARNLFLSPDQNFERKIKEMLLALQIEKKFTKDEILELYLNQIYFGSGAYGVQQASKTYYGKACKDLTLAEGALIGGLPQAPSEFSPLVSPRAAHNRQVLVLGRMRDTDAITPSQYRDALEEAKHPHFAPEKKQEFQVMDVPYFTTYLIHQLYERFHEDLLYRGGLQIHTTVDLKLQNYGEKVVHDMVKTYGPALHADSAALICIENKTGFIRAMVGGLGWKQNSQFNRAWQSRRRPGSSFKMFVYTAAMEAGYTPDTTVDDSPLTIQVSPTESWSPKNSDGRFAGYISIRTALQQSRNVIAVKLLEAVGVQRIIDLAYRMGITDKLDPNPSLALGAVGLSPLQMASAYTVLPNLGTRNDVTCIKSISDSAHTIEDHTFPHQEEVVSEVTATMMTEMLRNVVEHGTGTAAVIPGVQVAGKTGTTDDYGDAWFVGFTPQYTTAVWVGNDNNSRMVNSFGGDLPARIWKQFMVYAQHDKPRIPFGIVDDHGHIGVMMCADSKKRATNGCTNTIRQFFAPGSVPTTFCDLHGRGQTTTPGGKHPGVDRSRNHEEDIPSPDDPLAEPPPDEPATPKAEPTSDRPIPKEPDAIPPPPNHVAQPARSARPGSRLQPSATPTPQPDDI